MKKANTSKVFDDLPYDPNSATSVKEFVKRGAVVTKGGGVQAVKQALAEARRGPQRKPTKELINIRLSPDVLAAHRAR